MPRGYLKHNKRCVGRKVARGGSSFIAPWSSEKDRWQWRYNPQREVIAQTENGYREYLDEEFGLDDTSFVDFPSDDDEDKKRRDVHHQQLGECPICYESGPLTKLMKNCKHPSACYSCLREMYLLQAQTDVTNYPLQCFHPSCNRTVQEAQVRKLVRSEREMAQHHRLHVLAKGYKDTEKNAIIHCPTCDHPRLFSKGKDNAQEKLRVFRCAGCPETTFAVENPAFIGHSTIRALESIKEDNIGINDGWGRCPGCSMVISKGDGCDHMHCFCGQDFSWEDRVLAKKSATIKVGRLAGQGVADH